MHITRRYQDEYLLIKNAERGKGIKGAGIQNEGNAAIGLPTPHLVMRFRRLSCELNHSCEVEGNAQEGGDVPERPA